jgi:hypothetical protein
MLVAEGYDGLDLFGVFAFYKRRHFHFAKGCFFGEPEVGGKGD